MTIMVISFLLFIRGPSLFAERLKQFKKSVFLYLGYLYGMKTEVKKKKSYTEA